MRSLLLTISVLAVCSCILYSCQSEEQLSYARYYVTGRDLYVKNCQNCHNSDGKGLGELIPPLTDSVFLKTNKARLACWIKYGMDKPITVNNKAYEEKMPGNPDLADIEVAEIVTYITNSFGNKLGAYDVTAAGTDLQNCAR